ncbi:hypothetical protein B0H14DRAFT_2658660 [Mycena olivaceomarginata]|nr:hypothetical protein B0H14DRAFT_2658660 [Mycena olivaceomarginata]
MDVHRSRAECMLRLGDISKGHNNLFEAIEFWETARPLFEQLSLAKQVEHIDGRLAAVRENVQEQYKNNLSGNVEALNALEIKDMKKLGLHDEKEIELVAV